jgi:hypothetical protein
MSKTIPLTRGQVAIVDDDDYERLSSYRWHASERRDEGLFRAERRGRRGEPQAVLMHRYIMGAVRGECVDHINHDTLDNRRENLRVCSYSQNNANRRKIRPGVSKYKGVFRGSQGKGWLAEVYFNGQKRRLGPFHDETEAAHAYDAAAREMHGEFAHLNFPARIAELKKGAL